MIKIPGKDKRWVQTNVSDVLGNLYATMGIDLSENEGRMRLGKRLVINASSSDDPDLGLPVAIKALGTKTYAVCGTRVFENGAIYPSAGFSENAVSGAPTNCHADYSDAEIFNGYLYVTANSTTVYKYDGSAWSNFSAGSNTGSVRLLCQYGERMYMTDGRGKIISWTTADAGGLATSGSYTLDFSSNVDARTITWMRAGANRIWIGTVNVLGGKGYVHEWDGISTQVTRSYRLEASGALACVIKDDIPYVMDSNANLLAWNGGSFKYLTGLNRESNKLLLNGLSVTTNRFIHPNGGSIIGGKVCFLINNQNSDNAGSIEATIPSGVWEYDEKKGLIHKHAFGLTKSSDTIIDYGQNRISRAGALSELNMPNSASNKNGTFLCGCIFFTDATTTKTAIFYDDTNDTLQKGGSFITTKLESQEVTDSLIRIWAKYRKFLGSGDKITIKYRSEESDDVEATITWTSATSLTSTADLSSFAVGDEMEVTQGLGSGKSSHITAISYSAPTYTITVDESYASATGTSKARFGKWTKGASITGQSSTYEKATFGTNMSRTWVQPKVSMILTGKGELEELQLITAVQQTSK